MKRITWICDWCGAEATHKDGLSRPDAWKVTVRPEEVICEQCHTACMDAYSRVQTERKALKSKAD